MIVGFRIAHCFLPQLNSLTADKRGVNVKFHKVLLSRCQEEFERDRDDDEMLKKKQKGLEAAKDVRDGILC